MTDIESLPVETFLDILKLIDGVTLAKCRSVCKKWKDCIDGTDWLWHEICKNEFKFSSKIAKQKSGSDCDWYHIYKNLKMWSKVMSFERNVREFYKFTLHDKNHALDVNYNILPLRDTRGVVMYDMSTLKYIPVSVPEKNCVKIANNDFATVILLKSGMYIQKTIDNITNMSEAFFEADNFVLAGNNVYFFNNRNVYKCDLSLDNLSSKLIIHCDYDIKDIQYDNNVIHIFTDCAKIVNVYKNKTTEVKPINVPPEWTKQIKYIRAINDKNFVCYSRNLFKIETDKYRHLYLDFPPITALFFYADIVLIGTRQGEILLYRLASQKRAIKPIFEDIATLPGDKFAVQLDVCERKSGPVIVVATFFEIFLIEIDFFPHEKELKKSFPVNKQYMYKRLLRLRDRIALNYS
ncbi:uncharacterized protein LOC114358356 [Ostrinia furnacalis]|uniref:uncharacterized protein LOC114358356 n=1 Tax=Ostrinia furnacalis TaxID=93504 RepID=UPI00103A31E7|nr:uncharacterized protein LOC114358356 [Ostrinia furnacalis]